MCKGGGGSGSTNTVVQNQSPPQNVLNNYQDAYDRAVNAVNAGYQTYGGNLVATNPSLPEVAKDAWTLSDNFGALRDLAQNYYSQATRPLWSGVPSFDTSGLPSQGIQSILGAARGYAPAATGYGNAATNIAGYYGGAAAGQAGGYNDLATWAAGRAPGIASRYGDVATGAAGQAPGIASLSGGAANTAANAAAWKVYNAGDVATGVAGQAPGVAGYYGNVATRAAGTAPEIASAYGNDARSAAAEGATYAGAYGNQALTAAGSAPGLINTYLSPYTQKVVDATQAQFNNQNAIQQAGIVGNAAAEGAWGSDRSAVAQGIVAGQEQTAQAPVIGNLYQQGYQSAVQAAQQEAALQAQTGLSAGQLRAQAEAVRAQAGIQAGQLGTQAAGLEAQTGIQAGQLGTQALGLQAQTGIQAGQLGLGAGGLQAQTELGGGQLGLSGAGLQAQTGIQAGELGLSGQQQQEQTALGAGQNAISANLGAGQLGAQANQNAGQLALGAGQLSMGAGQGLLGEYNTQQQAELGANEANAWLASQAAAGIGNLGMENYNVQRGTLDAALQTGALEQQQQQAQLNVPYQQWLGQQAFPYQAAQFLSGIATGTGSLSGGRGTTTSPGASPWSQALGLGIGGAGLIGATGGFGANGWLSGLLGGGIGAASAIPPALDEFSSALLAAPFFKAGGSVPQRQDGGSAPMMGITPNFLPSSPQIPDVSISVFPQSAMRSGIGPGPPHAPPAYSGSSSAITPTSALQMLNSIGTIRNLSKNGGIFGDGSMHRGGGIVGYDEGGDVLDLPDVSVTAQAPPPSSRIVPNILHTSAPLSSPTPGAATPMAPAYRPDPWLALAAAGFGAAAGRSPQAMQNLGAGALQGLQFYEQQREAAPSLDLREAQAEQARIETQYMRNWLDYDKQHPLSEQLFGNIQQATQDHKTAAGQPTLEGPLGGGPIPSSGSTVGVNNPGNLKGTSGEYLSFPTMAAGLAAIPAWFDRAQNTHGLTTPRQLIDDPTHGYAPSADPGNAGKNLVGQFASRLGVGPDDPINVNDPAIRQKLVPAIVAQEGTGVKVAQAGPTTMTDASVGQGFAPFNSKLGDRTTYDWFQNKYAQYEQTMQAIARMPIDPRNPQARLQLLQNEQANLIRLREQDPWMRAQIAGMEAQARVGPAVQQAGGEAAAKLPYTTGSVRPGGIATLGGQPSFSVPLWKVVGDSQGNKYGYWESPPMPGQPPPSPPKLDANGIPEGAQLIEPGPGQHERLVKRGSEEETERDRTLDNAQAARYQQATLYRMRDDADQFFTGKFADHVQDAASVLRLIDPSWNGQVAHYEDFMKNMGTLTRAATHEASPRASFQEMQFIGGSLPNPEMSPQGLRNVLAEYIGLNDYKMAKAKAQAQWEQQHNGSVEGFEAGWQAHPPVTPYTYMLQRMDPTERQDLFAKWGKTYEGRTVLQNLHNQRLSMINSGLDPQQLQ